jgi:hypothetical protein
VEEFTKSESGIRAYYEGLSVGIWRYAWMKDGVYYVGTTGKTLKEANSELKHELEIALSDFGVTIETKS